MINDKLFNETIDQLQQQFGKHSINVITNNSVKCEVIPTGSLQLDRALGVGGYPKGRIIEIYGNESSGKTTLALQAISQCQKMQGKCAYIDLEHALDAKFCEVNGVDLSKMLLANPDSGEQAFSLIEALIKTGMMDLIVVDSVAALVPEAELNGEFEEQNIGLHARLMSKGMRLIQPLLAKYKTTIIFLNQIREKIGVMFGNNETTTGGRALRFFASIRIELKRIELIKNSTNECIGIRSCAKIVKNKVATPLFKAYIDIYFSKGFDFTFELIDFALEKNIIEKKGAYYYFDGNKIGQGKENTKKFLLEHETIFEKVREQTLALKQQD